MSASRIEIPNVREPAVFDQHLYHWVRRKCDDAAPVFTNMALILQQRRRERLRNLLRVEFFGADIAKRGIVYVKCVRENGESWQEEWLFDSDGSAVAFCPAPSQ